MKNKKTVAIATVAIMLSMMLYMFYVTARAVILPTVMTEFNGMNYYSVTIIMGSMMMAVTTPAMGKLGDIFGRKNVYIGGLLGYAATLAVMGTTKSLIVFILGVALCGITYGAVYATYAALVAEIYDSSTTPKIMGFTTVVSAIAQLAGPIVGGWCADHGSWRMVFWIVIPFVILTAVLTLISFPSETKAPAKSSMDIAGTLLFAAAVMPILYMLTSAGKNFPWISGTSAILMAVAAVSLVALIICEKKAQNPIVPGKLFKSPIYMLCLGVTLVAGLCYSVVNYLPMFYQTEWGMSSTMSGFMSTPRQIAMMVSSVAVGNYLSKKKNYKVSIVVPAALLFVAIGLMSRYSPVTPLFILVAAELFWGLGDGSFAINPNSMGQTYLSKEDMGSGLAFISFASTFGNSFGSALIGCAVGQMGFSKGFSFYCSCVVVAIAALVALVLTFKWNKYGKQE